MIYMVDMYPRWPFFCLEGICKFSISRGIRNDKYILVQLTYRCWIRFLLVNFKRTVLQNAECYILAILDHCKFWHIRDPTFANKNEVY